MAWQNKIWTSWWHKSQNLHSYSTAYKPDWSEKNWPADPKTRTDCL